MGKRAHKIHLNSNELAQNCIQNWLHSYDLSKSLNSDAAFSNIRTDFEDKLSGAIDTRKNDLKRVQFKKFGIE